MFYGVEITTPLQDWQVLQRHGGRARLTIGGRWQLESGAIRAGVSSATPVLRLVNEQDQSWVFPWTPCTYQTGGDRLTGPEVRGEWRTEIELPEGGPYRIETSLDAVSRATGEHWMFRGDIRVHIGVGDVFCMAGQSNAAGYAKGWAFDPPDLRVRLQRNSGRWDMAAHPMNDATDTADCPNAPMGITGTSPFLSFGRRYADFAGVPVGLIQAAQGGSPISRWDESRNGDLFRNMMRKLGPGADIRAILWYQGCADADPDSAARYAESFARLVADTRREAGWAVPFFTMQLNRYETQPDPAAWGAVKEAQRQAALTMDQVFILPTAGLPQSDEIHNSAAGNVLLGELLARQAHAALNGGPAFEAPMLLKAEAAGDGIRLAFDHTDQLVRLRAQHDLADFRVTDEKGTLRVTEIAVEGSSLLLTLDRQPGRTAFVSYGSHPHGPEGIIADQRTYLPLVSFDHVEVTR